MTSRPAAPAPSGRRAEYARLTRESILEAARELFVSQGYFGTTVEEIARNARVAPATVYAVGGGKHGLLRTLIEVGAATTEQKTQIAERIAATTDAGELLSFLIHTTRVVFDEWSGLMRQVVAAAPQEAGVRESQQIAHDSLRGGLELTATRLEQLGELRSGLSVGDAADILWLHLCNAAYFIRTDDLGWSGEKSEAWLNEVLPAALLTP